ncbi:hypothetical protein [Mesobacterium pallidum]|nr:hypothetical protein [Mesobacterium pallidum]
MELIAWLLLNPIGAIAWAGGCLVVLVLILMIVDVVAFWLSN